MEIAKALTISDFFHYSNSPPNHLTVPGGGLASAGSLGQNLKERMRKNEDCVLQGLLTSIDNRDQGKAVWVGMFGEVDRCPIRQFPDPRFGSRARTHGCPSVSSPKTNSSQNALQPAALAFPILPPLTKSIVRAQRRRNESVE
jgi:hypothetical protein